MFASSNLESIGRYVSVAFAFAWLVARRTIFWSRVWPMASARLLGVFALLLRRLLGALKLIARAPR